MYRKISRSLVLHIQENLLTYFVLFITFAVGVSAGAFTVNGLSIVQREELVNYLNGFLNLMGQQNIDSSELLRISIFENLRIIVVIWILGVSIIGIPFIFVVIGIRGFITGFSSAFIIDSLGAKGILFIVFTFIPRELIVIPCIIAISVRALNFSRSIIHNRSKKNMLKGSLKKNFISYIAITALYSILILPAVFIEAYLTPVLVRFVIPFMLK